MTRKKEIEAFIKEIKNVRKYSNCNKCPISSRNIHNGKYNFLNNAKNCCSGWYLEITGISVIGQGCDKLLNETIKHFEKVLRSSVANKI